MSGLFSALNSARSGLLESQTALSLTSHNIANANTEGYTRQTLELYSVQPDDGSYRAKQSTTLVGNGVADSGVTQNRDPFLDTRYRNANSKYTDMKEQSSAMTQIESIFNEFSSSTSSSTTDSATGMSGQLTSLITDLQKYQSSSDTTNLPATIQSDVNTIAYTIRNNYASLTDFQKQEQNDLGVLVDGGSTSTNVDGGINAMLSNISELNSEISAYELSGQTANDLRDQRNLILDKLSGYVDITTSELAGGAVTVSLQSSDASGNTQYLVDASNAVHKLAVTTDATTDTTSVVWKDDTTKAAVITGGKVDAYLQILNGNGAGTTSTNQYGGVGILYLKDKLNTYADTVKNIMNNTATVNGKTSASTYGGKDLVSGTSAADINLSSDWSTNSNLFADDFTAYQSYAAAQSSATTPDTSVSTDSSIGDYAAQFVTNLGSAALSSLSLSNISDIAAGLQSGSLLSFADTFTSEIANATSNASDKASSTSDIVDALDTQRQSISSVSIDEEGINIIKYQQAYNASARVITAVDEMLDKLINGTGASA